MTTRRDDQSQSRSLSTVSYRVELSAQQSARIGLKNRILKAKLMRDTSGSSVLIALVFFLICAIIGSIVVTAASVNSKVTATYREAQQAEYVVTSATRALGDLVEGSQITWTYDEGSTKPSFGNEDSYKECATILKHVWITYGDAIWSARASGADYSVPEVFTLSIKDMKDTYARVVVDRDLNIELVLSLDEVQSTTSEYNETAYLQAEPSYDSSGKLLSLSWADARIVKTADDVSGDKS